jgi:hypothetical protein
MSMQMFIGPAISGPAVISVACKTISKRWKGYGTIDTPPVTVSGGRMWWMWFTVIWNAAICIVALREFAVTSAGMNTGLLFHANGGIFAPPAIKNEWSNTANGYQKNTEASGAMGDPQPWSAGPWSCTHSQW